MNKELKKRISTSIVLFLILSSMIVSNVFFVYFLIIFSILAFIEFTNLSFKIFKSQIYLLISNLSFSLYIFTFSIMLLINFFNLESKILTLIIILICIFSDIGGLVFGKFFKGPKLTKISPKKTYSGACGSILFSIFVSYMLFTYIFGVFSYYYIILGIGISIGTQVGDLFFSYLKRKARIKNTGNSLPGHGGILDRIDGILLGVPTGIVIFVLL